MLSHISWFSLRANKRQYITEFLYLKKLIDSAHTSREVQQAISSALLLNPTGREDGWFAVDLGCEFVNRYVKEQWRYRRTSTASVQDLSEFCTLNSIFFGSLRSKLQELWGRTIRPRHTATNRGNLLKLLAKNIFKSMAYDNSREDEVIPGVSVLYDKAYLMLLGQLTKFNEKFLYYADDDVDVENDLVVAVDHAEYAPGPVYDEPANIALQEAQQGLASEDAGLNEWAEVDNEW